MDKKEVDRRDRPVFVCVCPVWDPPLVLVCPRHEGGIHTDTGQGAPLGIPRWTPPARPATTWTGNSPVRRQAMKSAQRDGNHY